MTQKTASFEQGPFRQDKALQQVQTVVQAALPLGPYEPAGPKVHETTVVDKGAVWSPWQISSRESVQRLLVCGAKTIPPSSSNCSASEKELLACCGASVKTEF